MPSIGSHYDTDEVRLQGLRYWSVKKFPAYQIYYFMHETRHIIEVLRVLHGNRDVDSLLADTEAM